MDNYIKSEVILTLNTGKEKTMDEKLEINERAVRVRTVGLEFNQFLQYQATDVKDRVKFLLEHGIEHFDY